MGWRGRGRSGRWPGNGPFNNLPPWQRPGQLYGYGRGAGYGYGGAGYGRGIGYRGYGGVSPYSCARFPWLPRWWWANPDYGHSTPYRGTYQGSYGYPTPRYPRAYSGYTPSPGQRYW